MNILIPHRWLLEHLDTEATPEKIQEKLSLSGPSVERIYERDGDSVYDIEITTNRVDSMSVRGVAREAGVILTQFGIDAKLKPSPADYINLEPDIPADQLLPLPKINNDPKLCGRIMAIVLKDVKHTPTPDWMAQRLTQVDMNVHDSVIDITNYITHELGHPVHAFDYDKLMQLGGQIIVKEAETGKDFTTLDGLNFKTVGGEVVFENNQGVIIDLPSIKGTLNSSVDESTKNILLLIDSVKATKVRFASMTHQIRTVAAQLLEKDVDPHLGLPTLAFGVSLYRQLCQAKVASNLYDDFPGEFSLEAIKLPLKTVEEYLGVQIPIDKIASILESLECRVERDNDNLTVIPPTFRADLSIPADLIEEIARIYGYHNLPSQLMQGELPQNKPDNSSFLTENKIPHFLSAIGWQEVYSFSIVSSELASQSEFSLNDHLALQNPLTEDHVYLRRSLLPSLEQILNNNSDRPELSIFELANTYSPQPNQLPKEEMMLGMFSNKPYHLVKGDLEKLLNHFFIKEIEVIPDKNSSDLQQGELWATQDGQKNQLGIIFVNHKDQVGCQISLSALTKVARSFPRYQPLANTSFVIEDLTFTLKPQTTLGPVMKTIKEQSPLIKTVTLTSEYQQNFTFRITYQDQEISLSSEDVKPARKKIISSLAKQFEAKLVGEL